ncbi:aspartate/tyrosine/aromatic aminotransferase [Sphingobium sp. PAMC28499]|jgi:aromatic-amino-acid transaminase|uniref:amino acid aminotransferase n=1 Tax=Sphingobium sp. PAMC28499 TaxID=2565554 RepID=UPI00109DB67C|nr:amino acid aminotransferase [Sphingobium sp. PAMC28499]QCB37177.1 aspartate/tyrosine/aromatic aminotransferase [Sphingobium sp. PAMC28499]
MTDTTLLAPAPGRSLFGALDRQAPDALLGLIAQYRADPRADKIDLGVGVYRDEAGATPVMRAVKAAEAVLLAEQGSKSYLGPEGDTGFVDLLAAIVFGPLAGSDRIAGVQTPGGTGALRLGADLIARARPGATVWIGDPTWPNHAPIFREAGLTLAPHRFLDGAGAVDFDAMLTDLAAAQAGDVLLLHGCCHNPTGVDFSADQWAAIADLCAARGLLPFIDLAYQGLGDGLEADAAATRQMLAAVPDALVAYSCDKNFGLYRERVGALWVQGANAALSALAFSNIVALARGIWSMPPDHGAAIVRTILERPAMRAQWTSELDQMRTRINALRAGLATAHPQLAAIAGQRGMFAMLPVTPAAVGAMRADHGIYMAGNGRINIAGLRLDTIPAFVAGLVPHLPSA